MKKKILCILFVSSLAVVGIFGISTNLFANGYTIETIEGAKHWKDLSLDLLNEATNSNFTEIFWENKVDDLNDGTNVQIDSSVTPNVILKAGPQLYLLRSSGSSGIISLSEINGKDISGYSVTESADMVLLGLFLLSVVAISKRKFRKSSF